MQGLSFPSGERERAPGAAVPLAAVGRPLGRGGEEAGRPVGFSWPCCRAAAVRSLFCIICVAVSYYLRCCFVFFFFFSPSFFPLIGGNFGLNLARLLFFSVRS